ncbi:MAG: RIP metalloprotease RseP [Patescibacteria group bacterium]
MNIIFTIIIFVVILGILVFVHELGHFGIAKLFKVGVEEFGFGYPPKILGIQKGKTMYSLNWIPVGGFVRIKGVVGAEEGSSNENYENDDDSFMNKSVGVRFSILIAGVIMNFLLAAVLFSIGFMIGLPAAIDNAPENAIINNPGIAISSVLDASPAQIADLQPNDKIVGVDGEKIVSINDFKNAVKEKQTISIDIERESEVITKDINIEVISATNEPGIGVALVETGMVSYPWYQAIYQGFAYTVKLTGLIFQALYQLLVSLVSDVKSETAFSGPIGIAVMTSEMAKMGFIYLLQFTALLSINLAIFNLLPIPALDGGRLFFLIIEKIKGSPVNQKIEMIIHNLGFYLLLLLIVIVTFKDVAQFHFLTFIKNIFI